MARPERIYAVGDVHGAAEALEGLLRAIAVHGRGHDCTIVLLGDYIDRGPDSARVVALLRRLSGTGRVVCLMGNHEQMLLRGLAEPLARAAWVREGGLDTLRSFGVRRAEDIPKDVVDWIAGLPLQWEDDRRIYVHAGLDPARPPDRQTDWARLWIREPFTGRDHDFGKHVVHGHSVTETGRPERRRFRTNIDTGACYGGPLTAAVFDEHHTAPTAFLQAAQDGSVTILPAEDAERPRRSTLRRAAAALAGIAGR